MVIGINLCYLLPEVVGGTEVYAAGLLRGLAEKDPPFEYAVFVNRESARWPIPADPRFKRVVCPVTAGHRGRRYLFEQFRLPGMLKRHRVDLVHSLGYVGPLRTPCPSIVTIPDLNFVALKDTLPFRKRAGLRFFSTQAARRARHILTISEFSKSEIVRFLKIEPRSVTVSYLGPRLAGTADPPPDPADVLGRYRLAKPYLVAFGGGWFHKNIGRLLKAFEILKDEFPHTFVIVGRTAPDAEIDRAAQALGKRLLATGFVPEAHILPLLGQADLFVLPSLYEGFGLPVLEAQQAGVAVACSKAASLPEIAGNGAVYFDPASVEAMVSVIRRCLSDGEFRAGLRLLGQENVRRFSWERTAEVTLDVYRRVLDEEASRRMK
jgi:glycosyltransferase involved in cell wall biosynthesis